MAADFDVPAEKFPHLVRPIESLYIAVGNALQDPDPHKFFTKYQLTMCIKKHCRGMANPETVRRIVDELWAERY